MTIKFITGNEGKFTEAKAIIPNLKQLDIDLAEIQEVDPRAVIEHKLLEALQHCDGPLMIEDTSVMFDCLGSLPGPFIKWFYKELGAKGLYELTEKYGNNKAEVVVLIGYAQKHETEETIRFFESKMKGIIVEPKGDNDFAWGPCFIPDGCDKTFGEMTREEKYAIAPRNKALEQLVEYLEEIGED